MTWEIGRLLPALIGLAIGRMPPGSKPPPAHRLDADDLPDAMKRDLGLMDGRGPTLRRPERSGRF
ncbi:MAG: hypothetical protein V7704_15940 [Aurantimonas endophytica]|uniref:DUF1127 domain-containing protein n=1 Tax=Aurantimonas endophytica TaxID=1522175 RepID=A0A7W6MP92_9HYPH|nr:hypothetical protein [Aurantimonas endophytica]MBB4002690.1 hypothetical protein [Aurantimonas endophytica]MCO6403570.1 hypothetical protein [Aurantimonas endophytica]